MPRISGRERVVARLNGMAGEKIVREVGKALFAGGELIRAEAAHLITEGAVSGKNHVPSLPGEPPNEDTGVLRAHIETTQPAPLRVEVSSNAPYAVPLEKGSKHKKKTIARHFPENKEGKRKFGPIRVEIGDSETAARPYMSPATRRKRKEVVTLIEQAVNRAVKK